METERTIRELLIILRDNANVTKTNLGFKQRIKYGLCYEVLSLCKREIINDDELNALNMYIFKYRPSYNNTAYGWKPNHWLPRLKWLNKHIELLNQYQ